MENNELENKNEEIQSRREFFKEAAKKTLPLLGAIVIANIPLKSFAKSEKVEWCDYGCDKGCLQSCYGSCSESCKGSCDGRCGGYCGGNCSGSCLYSCGTSCHSSNYTY